MLGRDVVTCARQVREVIGLTGQYAAVDDLISARENLYLVGRLLGLRRRAARARGTALLEAFGLADAAGTRVREFSGGMRRRLDLAVSLVGRPAVLFLDEPTTGLDLASRNQLWDLIRGLAADGTTVLLTTQYLEEADRLADRIMVIDRGATVAEGTPAELKGLAGGQVLEVRPLRPADLAAAVSVLAGLRAAEQPAVDGDLLTVHVPDEDLVAAAASRLDSAGIGGPASGGPAAQPRRGVPGDDRASRRAGQRPRHRTTELGGAAAMIAQTGIMARRNLLHVLSDPQQLIGMTAQPLMFLLLFVYVFGGAIAGSSRGYLQFVLPGLLVQGIAFQTMVTALGLNADFQHGLIDRFRSLPMARSAVVAGRITADLARTAWAALIIVAVAVGLGFRFRGGVPGAVGALGLVLALGASMCWVMAFLGTALRSPEAVQATAFMLVMPLTFASTVLVPAASMPGWLQAFVRINPITIFAEAMRGLMLGGPVATPLLQAAAWMAGLCLVFGTLTVRRYRTRA